GKLDRLIERKNERKPIEAFYAARNYAPLWSDNGAANARAKAAIARLKDADADGLDPADYPTPDLAAAATPEALADVEIRLTASVLNYARHARVGRVHYSRVSADIDYNLVPPEPAEVLGKMADARDAGEALGSYNPPHEGYRLLREKLAEARGRTGDTGPARIAAGPVLKVGMQDARVPLLRERLGLADADNTSYDKLLAEAVKKFQRSHDLSATGTLTGTTIDAMNGPNPGPATHLILPNMHPSP